MSIYLNIEKVNFYSGRKNKNNPRNFTVILQLTVKLRG